jgi:hypothetical protein
VGEESRIGLPARCERWLVVEAEHLPDRPEAGRHRERMRHEHHSSTEGVSSGG